MGVVEIFRRAPPSGRSLPSYSVCFMLVYGIYCIVASLLLFSPSIDKPCTCNMCSAPPPRLVHKLFAVRKVM